MQSNKKRSRIALHSLGQSSTIQAINNSVSVHEKKKWCTHRAEWMYIVHATKCTEQEQKNRKTEFTAGRPVDGEWTAGRAQKTCSTSYANGPNMNEVLFWNISRRRTEDAGSQRWAMCDVWCVSLISVNINADANGSGIFITRHRSESTVSVYFASRALNSKLITIRMMCSAWNEMEKTRRRE